MKLNNIEFDAFVASPGIGKSYLADNYENIVDLDEVRLKCKYFVPDNISRVELEQTKGNREFKKRDNFKELLNQTLVDLLESNALLLAAPHNEMIDFFIKHNVRYCFVYPSMECKYEIVKRWIERGNSPKFIEENYHNFDVWYNENIIDKRPTVHYALKQGEYLSDVLIKAGVTLNKKL